LADVTQDDLRQMLTENETLFVEHKTSIDRDAYVVAKAVSSFANTLGGWVLIGVTDGEPNEGDEAGWVAPAPYELTDRAREALSVNGVDPVPAFAATVMTHKPTGRRVGLIRVYESSDTPHVMRNGQVFVRSVAQDRRAERAYRARGIETQAGLLALANRGRSGVEEARHRFQPDRAPLAAAHVGLSSSHLATMTEGIVGLRAVPVTGARLADWGVSRRCLVALDRGARTLAGASQAEVPTVRAHASGIAVTAKSLDLLGIGPVERDGVALVGTDAAGLVVAAMQFNNWQPPRPKSAIDLDGVRDLIVAPLLDAVVDVLVAGELFGRVLLEVRFGHLSHVVELEGPGGPRGIPTDLAIGGELALPMGPDEASRHKLLDDWRSDIGRAAGFLTFRR
jgi:hypothetical protein